MFEKELEQYEIVREKYEKNIIAHMDSHDYQEFTEVLFSTHSCAIEGNSFTIDDTRTLKELGWEHLSPRVESSTNVWR